MIRAPLLDLPLTDLGAPVLPRQPLQILVVDDDFMSAMVVAELVEEMGHVAVMAQDGEQACGHYHDKAFDIVLVDQLMPGLDGIGLTQCLRRLQEQQDGWRPILMLSSFSHTSEQILALEAGCDDFIAKPVHADMLAAKIASFERILVLQRQLQEQNQHYRQLQAERDEEGRVAHQLMSRLVNRAQIERASIHHFVTATQQISGDLVLATQSATGDRYVMLADATGHGLPAALTQIPLSQTFYAMAERGFQLVSIVEEMNRHHRQYAPVYRSIAAVIAVYRVRHRVLEVWNGGMPEAMLLNSEGEVMRRFKSRNLPLGVDADRVHYCECDVLSVSEPCQLVLYSDGIIEALSPYGDPFGQSQLEMVLSRASRDRRLDAVQLAVNHHLAGKPADDDLSCLVVDCDPQERVQEPVSRDAKGAVQSDHWRVAMSLGASRLRKFDLVPSVVNWATQLGLAPEDAPVLSLVLAELLSNAVAHGLLQLDSTLKSDRDGFNRYNEALQHGLATLNHGALELEVGGGGGTTPLYVWMHDSGRGFAAAQTATGNDTSYYGRGLRLLQALSRHIEFRGCGNEVFVEIERRTGD